MLSAISGPSRRARISCHGVAANGGFLAANLNSTLARYDQELPLSFGSFPEGGFVTDRSGNLGQSHLADRMSQASELNLFDDDSIPVSSHGKQEREI